MKKAIDVKGGRACMAVLLFHPLLLITDQSHRRFLFEMWWRLLIFFEQPLYRRPGPWTAVGKQREEAPKHLSTGRALPEKIISDQTSRLALTLFEAFIS
jgi:hypothetical protein